MTAIYVYASPSNVEEQQRELRQLCAGNGWKVEAEYVEVTGTERAEFHKLVRSSPTRVVVSSLMRLAWLPDDLAAVLALDVPIVTLHGPDLSTRIERDSLRTWLGIDRHPSSTATDSAPGGADRPVALPPATKAFNAHFTHPMYHDPTRPYSPFAPGRGWHFLSRWAGRRYGLHLGPTVAKILQDSEYFLPDDHLDDLEAANVTVGAAFTLLHLTGDIDEPGRQQATQALEDLLDHYGPTPELLQQKQDLQTFRSS